SNANLESLEFEDRLTILLFRKVGYIQKLNQLDARLMPYIRLYAVSSSLIAEYYLAVHIMFRGLSLGFLILALVFVRNFFYVAPISIEMITLPIVSLVLSLASFRRAVSFRRWRYREILLCFYHLAIQEQQNLNKGAGSTPPGAQSY